MPLRIIGDGPLAPLVREMVSCDPVVQWLGRQPLDAVYRQIGEAEFAILPSICFEAFPGVIAEAFARGTPVIASRIGAMAELVDEVCTGLLFDSGDPADLARAVRQQWSNRSALSGMRGAARAEFEANFTGDLNRRRLMQAYAQALGSPLDVRKRAGIRRPAGPVTTCFSACCERQTARTEGILPGCSSTRNPSRRLSQNVLYIAGPVTLAFRNDGKPSVLSNRMQARLSECDIELPTLPV